jgi:hypothetical protein
LVYAVGLSSLSTEFKDPGAVDQLTGIAVFGADNRPGKLSCLPGDVILGSDRAIEYKIKELGSN